MAKKSQRRKFSTLERTAFHEAGHAVAAYHFARKIRVVSIIPEIESNSLGRVITNKIARFRPDCDISPRVEFEAKRLAIELLFGTMVEKLMTGRHNYRGASSDFEAIHNLACNISGSGRTAQRLFDYWWSCAQDMIENLDWIPPAVAEISQQLLKKQRLTGDEVRSAISHALGFDKPLETVKGRPS